MVGIEARGLSKKFGSVTAVDNLSFSVEPGKVTGFLGPNGAGKTTTLRMMVGLVAPSSGQALVNGVAYRQLARPSVTVGAVLEASGFHPARSARSHLRVVATAAGIDLARVDEVLSQVGLQADATRKVGGFSMGMRQRLELARALLGDPEILILDEPSNGLDPQGIAWMRGFLRWYASQGRVVLMSSHLLAEAAQTVDEVIILAGGRLAARGPLRELLQGAKKSVRVRTDDQGRLLGALQSAGVTAHGEGPDTVVADNTTPEIVGPVMATNGIVVYEMTSSSESLEQLFFEMTEGSGLGREPMQVPLSSAPPPPSAAPPPLSSLPPPLTPPNQGSLS